MKTSKSICLLCRHRLAANGRPQAAQWTVTAAYSTSGATAASVGHDGSSAPSEAHSSAGGAASDAPRPQVRRYRYEERRPRPQQSLTSTPAGSRRRINADNKAGTDMDSLFQQIVHRRKTDDALAADALEHSPRHANLVQEIGSLQQMLDTGAPVSQAYTFLQTELYPSIRHEDIQVPKVFFTVANNVMNKIIEAKKDDIWNPDLPRVADIFRVCAELGDMRSTNWSREWLALVGELITFLCRMKTSREDYPSIEAYEKHLHMKDEALTDLVESWKLLSIPKHMNVKPSGHANEILDGFWFPRLDKFAVKKWAMSKRFTVAFNSLFPHCSSSNLGDGLAVAAFSTFLLLMDRSRSNATARKSTTRFMSKVTYMIKLIGINDKALRSSILSTFPAIETYVMDHWTQIKPHLDEISQQAAQLQGSEAASGSPRGHPEAANIERKLSSAYWSHNRSEVDRLWAAFVSVPKENARERMSQLQQSPNLFDSFINTYMAFNQPDKAIEVWNTMPKVGLRPTLKTWNVMLDGCKRAHNPSGLQAVWKRLVASGQPLDVAIWTTRIAGLMACDDPKGAVDALEEMAVLWDTAQQKGHGNAVQPAIQPVNAALQGFIRLNNNTAAHKILAWAKAHGIKPDVVTFNLLLRPAIREGRDKEVEAIFQSMKTLGVQADAATFTLILDGSLNKVDSLDPKRQSEIVESVFREMEDAGLEPNQHTYGKMIHLLLRSGDRAQESVKAVLDHLWGQGHEFSPHIYTMLVEHYFSRQPPDLKAVDDLLERREVFDYDDMDRIFYDRVVKGYALVGDIDSAFRIYSKLSEAGFLVTLSTQQEVLKTLVQLGRADDARAMVADTVKKYVEQHGEGGWRGHGFWHVASRAGLVDWSEGANGGRAVLRRPYV
ncbi:uncharacterized protein JN550_006834 [Neoarthrinium moseri]|uniref:uncharacterized protein n=1 Tax=Neoarthrinium moseri TaxID=1658444 RepID=UPI001FDC06D0|nr:uncharacterized protein JN550_006834 [Neoarthrinium moseri]KAI1867693.1 hypothetical protein JN550_006834 [Neoarthrinium moseri]